MWTGCLRKRTLSQEEIFKILSSVNNIKHKAILMLIYSARLRVSEVVKLKPEDVDTGIRLIYVRGGKGSKDRYRRNDGYE
ncbi:hypothetical protein DRN97_12760 [Methanosarcinales archaeon]|nr:MAG: hypothetical protein DRN97_12760 [Methanosarcinales archaeon]